MRSRRGTSGGNPQLVQRHHDPQTEWPNLSATSLRRWASMVNQERGSAAPVAATVGALVRRAFLEERVELKLDCRTGEVLPCEPPATARSRCRKLGERSKADRQLVWR